MGSMEMGMEKDLKAKAKADKSLYVCFGEYQSKGTVSYVFRELNFSHDYTSNSVSHLFKISGKAIPTHMGFIFLNSPQFGFHFILAGGVCDLYRKAQGKFLPAPSKQICVFDSDGKERQPKSLPNFNYGKSQPLLWLVGDELFALSQMPNRFPGDPTSIFNPGDPIFNPGDRTSFFEASSFEVFNIGKKKWSTLPDPPCYKYYTQVVWNTKPFSSVIDTSPFSYAIAGSTLFVAATDYPTFRINLADPTNRVWTEVGPPPPPPHLPSSSPSGSGSYLPFQSNGKTLVVNAGEDNGFLVFSYNALDELSDPNHISVHLVPYQCDSKIVLNSVSLPEAEWCSDFLPPENYCFVDLGDCEACLLLSGGVTYEVERMQIRVIPFEFKLVKGNSLPSVEVKFRPTQPIVHQTDQYIGDMQMIAAFCGPPSQTPRE